MPEQLPCLADDQIAFCALCNHIADCHLGSNAHAQTEPHVGCDHIGVNRFQRDPGCQFAGGKSLIDFCAARVGRVIGDQWLKGNVFKRDVLLQCQRVAGWKYQHVLPLVTGQGDQLGVLSQRFGGNADFCHFINQHARHLLRRALVQTHVDFWVGLPQAGHRLGQHVAGLRVGGGDRERATVFCAVLLTNAFEVAHLAHDQLNAFEDMLARFGDAFETLAVPCKNLDAQLFFKLNDGFGHTGLRGVEGFGRLGQVEVAPGSFLNKTKLMQIHVGWFMPIYSR